MDIQDLRKESEKSKNKLDIFGDLENFTKYDISKKELYDVIEQFLTDEEKAKLFEFPHFQNLGSYSKEKIISLVSDSKIKLQMIKNDAITGDFDTYQIVDLIVGLKNDLNVMIKT